MPHVRTRMLPVSSRRAFTKTETIVIIVVVVVVFCGLIVICGFAGIMLPALGKARASARQLKDSTQVRGITQALVVWASNNKGSYPLPSELDSKNFTIAGPAESKDTTANILSMMVFSGMISPEICISPAEANTAQIQVMRTYQYASPSTAANPAKALWDPAFRGTPEDRTDSEGKPIIGVGNQSYAHALPFGNRRAQWSDTYNSTEAVFGNRGPTYVANDAAPSSARWSLLPGPLGTNSNTLLIHGGRSTWEGNIAYNDNHVNFEVGPTPMGVTLKLPGPTPKTFLKAPDNIFVNETDELDGDGATGTVDKGVNAYLRPIAEVKDAARPRTWRD